VWRQAFKIARVSGDTVDGSNGAAAVSSCERCRTAAVAIALNRECLSCATYAGASS
jgi:hypothetical protein